MKFYTGDEIIYKDPETGERYRAIFLDYFGIPGVTARIHLDNKYRIIVPINYLLPGSVEVFMDPATMSRQAPDVDAFTKAADAFEKQREAKEAASVFAGKVSVPPMPKSMALAKALAGGTDSNADGIKKIFDEINADGMLETFLTQIVGKQDPDF